MKFLPFMFMKKLGLKLHIFLRIVFAYFPSDCFCYKHFELLYLQHFLKFNFIQLNEIEIPIPV